MIDEIYKMITISKCQPLKNGHYKMVSNINCK